MPSLGSLGFRYKRKIIRGVEYMQLKPPSLQRIKRAASEKKYPIDFAAVVHDAVELKSGDNLSLRVPLESVDFVAKNPELLFSFEEKEGWNVLGETTSSVLFDKKVGGKSLVMKVGSLGHGDQIHAAQIARGISTPHASLKAPRYYVVGRKGYGIQRKSFTVMEQIQRPTAEEYIEKHPQHAELVECAHRELLEALQANGFNAKAAPELKLRNVFDETLAPQIYIDSVNPKTGKVRFIAFDLGHALK